MNDKIERQNITINKCIMKKRKTRETNKYEKIQDQFNKVAAT